MINEEMAWYAARVLGVRFDKFPFQDFVVGCNIELEHGSMSPATNVTNDDLILTAKIALAHLNEHPKYYDREIGLPAMEAYLKSLGV
ncbi:MAG: hypothetical protein E7191_01940 [Erysipelotrichaceae bacterium]|nr:hypothetical protein [Erysipelotrichaceae bacterium]MBQ9987321.1 hypothetical protein [Erysipelotrichales bacterium]MBR3693995.1 hypothetical protein [Erysipelotrichales bacterium]